MAAPIDSPPARTRKSALHGFLVVTYEGLMRSLFSLPRYPLLNRLKASFLRCRGARVGKRVVFYPGVWIVSGDALELGDDVDLALEVLITCGAGAKVRIGDRTLVGYRTQIISANHVVPPKGQRIFDAGHERKDITIGSDVWIGANCLILGGVTIGEGAVVAGGSVVTRPVPAFAIVAGVPARIIRWREGAEPTNEGKAGPT